MPNDERRRRDDDDRDDRPPRDRRRDDDDRDDPPRKSRSRDDDRDNRARKARRRDDDEPDDYDDLPPERGRDKPRRKGGDGFARVVPYRNGPALAAYYCGVFGLIPIVGLLLGPIAFILGIIGFVKARKNPEARGTGHAIAGIILGIIDVPLWFVLWKLVFERMTDPAR